MVDFEMIELLLTHHLESFKTVLSEHSLKIDLDGRKSELINEDDRAILIFDDEERLDLKDSVSFIVAAKIIEAYGLIEKPNTQNKQ